MDNNDKNLVFQIGNEIINLLPKINKEIPSQIEIDNIHQEINNKFKSIGLDVNFYLGLNKENKNNIIFSGYYLKDRIIIEYMLELVKPK